MRTYFGLPSVPHELVAHCVPWRKKSGVSSRILREHGAHVAVRTQIILQAQFCNDLVNGNLKAASRYELGSAADLSEPSSII